MRGAEGEELANACDPLAISFCVVSECPAAVPCTLPSRLLSSSQIAQDFATLIDDPDQRTKSDYTETVVSMRQEHQSLAGEHVPRLQSTFSTQILAAIDEEIVKNAEIAKRITRRMEVRFTLNIFYAFYFSARCIAASHALTHTRYHDLYSLCLYVFSQLFGEEGYYQGKVNELRDEREKVRPGEKRQRERRGGWR